MEQSEVKPRGKAILLNGTVDRLIGPQERCGL